MSAPFDVVVFGATGFTGRLVAEYLNSRYGMGGGVAWAIAGRDLDKLAALRRQIGAPATLPLLQGNAAEAASLAALARQARVVISTVGPYQLHGEPLVRACAEAGTDYVDLCGEPAWMARMIARYKPDPISDQRCNSYWSLYLALAVLPSHLTPSGCPRIHRSSSGISLDGYSRNLSL